MAHKRVLFLLVAAVAVAGISVAVAQASTRGRSHRHGGGHGSGSGRGSGTVTPIKHVVVIFQENESFDHYFGTYPRATNPAGEPQFTAAPGTPSVNGLSNVLLSANPNESNPRRLDRSEAVTCSQDHSYASEEKAFDHGLMDEF